MERGVVGVWKKKNRVKVEIEQNLKNVPNKIRFVLNLQGSWY
jgi:hypothetical protein